MSCYHPLPGVQSNSGNVSIGRHLPTYAGENPRYLDLPCGVCIGCRQDKAREWSIRINHEASLYDSNLFVTLTYTDESVPEDYNLHYPHFQAFMRRLRKEVRGVNPSPLGTFPIRFFVSGEYGEKLQRPHWHAILFNTRFADQVVFHNGTYRSSTLERIWQSGDVVIGDVTPASAAYVAGYSINKARQSLTLYGRRAPFCEMSVKPGIGSWWYEKFRGDLFPNDHAVHDGRPWKVPRFYHKRFELDASPEELRQVDTARFQRAADKPLSERCERRRLDREEVAYGRRAARARRSL